MKKPTSIHEMLSQLDEPFTGESLFDHLPDIVFFIKNIHGQYVIVNNTLVERVACRQIAIDWPYASPSVSSATGAGLRGSGPEGLAVGATTAFATRTA